MKFKFKKTNVGKLVMLFVLAIVSASDNFEDPNICGVCWTPLVKNKGVFQGVERCPNECNWQCGIVSAATFQREYGCDLKMQFQGTCPNHKKDFVIDVTKELKSLVPNANYKCLRAETGIHIKQFKKWYFWEPTKNLPTFMLHFQGTQGDVKGFIEENQLIVGGKKYFCVTDTCPVCLDTVSEGAKIAVLSCTPQHMFCEFCLAKVERCPKCRKAIKRKDQIEEKLWAVANETVLLPWYSLMTYSEHYWSFASYFYSTLTEIDSEYASYGTISNSLILSLFVPCAFFLLEMVAKQYGVGSFLNLDSVITWEIASFIVHHIHKKLGLNEKFFGSIIYWKVAYWYGDLALEESALAVTAFVTSLLNSAVKRGRFAFIAVNVIAILPSILVAVVLKSDLVRMYTMLVNDPTVLLWIVLFWPALITLIPLKLSLMISGDDLSKAYESLNPGRFFFNTYDKTYNSPVAELFTLGEDNYHIRWFHQGETHVAHFVLGEGYKKVLNAAAESKNAGIEWYLGFYEAIVRVVISAFCFGCFFFVVKNIRKSALSRNFETMIAHNFRKLLSQIINAFKIAAAIAIKIGIKIFEAIIRFFIPNFDFLT